ncbi:MAG: phospholipase D-like domain-containing protein [Bacteroidales bacterium]|jgi:cardiolipin synthase|nr:phospholipase D-like domain-containing protein [Bacteroidales bacterium]
MKTPFYRHNYRGGHQVALLSSGEPFFAAVEKLIDEARHFIHFQAYLLDEDETGKRIAEALIRAAGRGVRVYLLLDAYGTKYLSKEFVDSIENAGILFRFFSPTLVTKGFQLSLRLHSKVVMADGEAAIIGGMNFADRYHGTASKKEWLDFAVSVRGPECVQILAILKRLWNKTFISRGESSREIIREPLHYPDDVKIRVLQSNWYRNKTEILKSYRSAIRHARERILIMASYFLPGRNERKLLKNASQRGVEITIVLAAESDAPMFDRATQFFYDFILRNRIRIYEYLPSNLHAKVTTVDGKWSTIGSYNINHISDYASVEVNIGILDEPFAVSFEETIRSIIRNDCREVTFEEFARRRRWYSRLAGWISYQMIRLGMRLMYQLTPKKNRKQPL